VGRELCASTAVQRNWEVVLAPDAEPIDDSIFNTNSSKPKVVLVAPQQLHYARLLWKLPKFRAVRSVPSRNEAICCEAVVIYSIDIHLSQVNINLLIFQRE
jgi:hypothetical protein